MSSDFAERHAERPRVREDDATEVHIGDIFEKVFIEVQNLSQIANSNGQRRQRRRPLERAPCTRKECPNL